MFRRSYFLFCVSFNRGKLCSGSQLNFSPVLSVIIRSYARVCVLAQLCPTLCKPVDCSPPGSSDHGIFQARILEWVAISSSRGSSWPREWTRFPCVSCIGRWIYWVNCSASLRLSCLLRSKESTCKAGDLGLIPGLGSSPGEGIGNPLQYSCLEGFIDKGA